MIKAIVSDFSRVLLFPKDKSYKGGLNTLHIELARDLNYKVLDHFEFNIELLDFYTSLKSQLPIHMFTSDAIQDSPEFQPYLQPIFGEIMSAKRMNVTKEDPEAYRLVATHLNLDPGEILYIDDAFENIEAAKSAGFNVVLYKDNSGLVERVNTALKN